jgi:hypothetical protein
MQTIDIDDVYAEDKTFSISYPFEDSRLLSSIARFGLLAPIALFSEKRPAVVLGFKRLAAARKMNIRQVPCVFLGVDEKTALLTAINDNIGRSLNTIEKMKCAERMSALGFDKPEIFEVLGLIGLPAREKTLETVAAAADVGEETRAFVVRHRLPLAAVEQLVWFDREERDRLVEIMDALDLTVSSLREVLQLAMLIKVKRGSIDIGQFAGARDMETLKHKLKQTTHPLLTEMESTLTRLLKACALPPNMKLHIDPFFEKNWIDVSVRVRNGEEVDNVSKKLRHLLAEGLFGSLFELTHGTPVRN